MLCSSDKIILLNITFMQKRRKHHKNSWNKIVVQVGEEEEHVPISVLLLAIPVPCKVVTGVLKTGGTKPTSGVEAALFR